MRKTKKALPLKKSQQIKGKKGINAQTEKQTAWKSFWDRYCQM